MVSYPYSNLEEGVHQLKIKVWDVYNNSSEAFTNFVVVADEGLVLENLMNYLIHLAILPEFILNTIVQMINYMLEWIYMI
ncbi:MAG: hypothetical protein CM15mP23_00370 [Cryomorphaceae bacterium]|nr:MAG: hypothetical protein CM15mP23_00370 [Cryomorphaceae bacterium]